MFLWFAGMSVVIVALVFRSPALDYRLVMVGSVLPIADAVGGGAGILHTMVASVALLTIVMLATRGRRLTRRRWIGLPIGMLLHMVLDGSWMRTELFWWPLFGTGFGAGAVPELDHGVVPTVVFELVGAAALVWFYLAFGLNEPDARDRFVHTGQLPRGSVE